MVRFEFGLFPFKFLRPNPYFLQGELPANVKDPWARREAWRSNPFFSLRNRMSRLVPGFTYAVGAFSVYVLYDQWYYSKGPGAESHQHDSNNHHWCPSNKYHIVTLFFLVYMHCHSTCLGTQTNDLSHVRLTFANIVTLWNYNVYKCDGKSTSFNIREIYQQIKLLAWEYI